jgi:hypothetical protein
LLCSLKVLPSEIKEAYGDSIKRDSNPSFDSLYRLFTGVAGRFSSVYVFFDALDEYHQNYHSGVLGLIQRLSQSSMKVMLTSRPSPEINKKLKKPVELPISARGPDLEIYINSELVKEQNMHIPPRTGRDIVTKLTSRAVGMYDLMVTYMANNEVSTS